MPRPADAHRSNRSSRHWPPGASLQSREAVRGRWRRCPFGQGRPSARAAAGVARLGAGSRLPVGRKRPARACAAMAGHRGRRAVGWPPCRLRREPARRRAAAQPRRRASGAACPAGPGQVRGLRGSQRAGPPGPTCPVWRGEGEPPAPVGGRDGVPRRPPVRCRRAGAAGPVLPGRCRRAAAAGRSWQRQPRSGRAGRHAEGPAGVPTWDRGTARSGAAQRAAIRPRCAPAARWPRSVGARALLG